MNLIPTCLHVCESERYTHTQKSSQHRYAEYTIFGQKYKRIQKRLCLISYTSLHYYSLESTTKYKGQFVSNLLTSQVQTVASFSSTLCNVICSMYGKRVLFKGCHGDRVYIAMVTEGKFISKDAHTRDTTHKVYQTTNTK